MLRGVLGVLLILVVGGLAYFWGYSAAAWEGRHQTRTVQGAADAERFRADTPATPKPPSLAPSRELEPPELPIDVPGQAPGDAAPLFSRLLGMPIADLTASRIQDTYLEERGGGERRHEATDILAPRGTPVLAVDNGLVAKLFHSKAGGLTVYQFDSNQRYAFYYAHLDRYTEGLKEGILLKKGDVLGYVGTTGNAPPDTPHLHFAIFELGPEKRWWEGKPINPYPILMRSMGR